MPFDFRDFHPTDRLPAAHLLDGLEQIYPGAETWFDDKIDDVLLGRAWGLVCTHGKVLAGLALITPKGLASCKLSTLKVAPAFRGIGVGSALISACCSSWRADGIRSASVTVNANDQSTSRFFLDQRGFRLVARLADRYGEGRDEHVFRWQDGDETIERARPADFH